MDLKKLYEWCSIPAEELPGRTDLKVPFRIVKDSHELGSVMARDLVEEIRKANEEQRSFRLIVPCGPKEWYGPFTEMVNAGNVSLRNMVCYHMDENLDWEGKLLPKEDPNNFRTFMERYFYGGIKEELQVLPENRHFLTPYNMQEMSEMIAGTEIDYTLGGWGQDGHVAFNQANRNPYVEVSLDDLRGSTARIQNNNNDTILALAQRGLGGAWQFMPPMSITLGVKECMKAKKVRVYSATGAWKQTALRVALFSEPTVE